ncbi:MAG: hypothetical protein AAGF95_30990 [Chloroflexota bacterium]
MLERIRELMNTGYAIVMEVAQGGQLILGGVAISMLIIAGLGFLWYGGAYFLSGPFPWVWAPFGNGWLVRAFGVVLLVGAILGVIWAQITGAIGAGGWQGY